MVRREGAGPVVECRVGACGRPAMDCGCWRNGKGEWGEPDRQRGTAHPDGDVFPADEGRGGRLGWPAGAGMQLVFSELVSLETCN